jgi:ATP-dependent protease ClpP protease subunit
MNLIRHCGSVSSVLSNDRLVRAYPASAGEAPREWVVIVVINSRGGELPDVFAIADALESSSSQWPSVDTFVTSLQNEFNQSR